VGELCKWTGKLRKSSGQDEKVEGDFSNLTPQKKREFGF